VATYATTTLTVGSHTITAIYNGDSLHFPSTVDAGSTVTQVVNETTVTSLATSGSPSVLGTSVTFTATVTPDGGGVALPLTDTVTFTDTTTLTTLCTPTIALVGAAYQATCTTAALAYGQHTITATYSGDVGAYILGSSTAITQDVQATSAPTLVSSLNPSYYGNAVQFTLTVPTIGSTVATGTINFYMAGQVAPINPSPLALVNVAGAGTASFTTSTLPVGTDSISATYSGDLYYSSGNSNTISQVVNQATTQTTVNASPNPAIATKAITITAAVTVTHGTSTPVGNVNFTDTFGGSTVTLACAPQPTVASPTCVTSTLAAGTHSIVATYVGDTNDTTSSSAPYALTVTQETVTLASNSNPSIYGMPVIFTVTVPSIGAAAATGTVNLLRAGQVSPIGTVTLAGNPGTGTFTTSSLPAGTDVITASYPGDSIYIAVISSTVNQVVNTATTSTTVAAVPTPGVAGAPVAITATVAVTQGVATPTGTVTFTDGVTTLGSATLSAGKAIISPMLAPGPHSIVATYGGDANDNTSTSSTLSLTVNQAVTTTTLISSANPSLVLAPVTFTATVASVHGGVPTGNVNFTDSLSGGATVPLACSPQPTAPMATCTTTTLATGTHTITANYVGDTNDVASTNTITQVVGTIPTVTDIGVTTTTGINPQVILVVAVLNSPTATSVTNPPIPTGTVIFSTVIGAVVTQIGSSVLDSSGVATLVPSLPTGTYNLKASYSGDTDHSASQSSTTVISTAPMGFNLTVTPATVTIAASGNSTVTVALTSINGFTDTIGLGCASLPSGVNCHFALADPTLHANSTQSVALTIDTNNPLGGGASAMNAHAQNRSISLAGFFLPIGMFFGCVFWRFRRRYAGLMTTGLILLLGMGALAISGCSGSFTQSTAAPGTYVIQVTGTGTGSNIIHYQNVSLTISAK
jgi:hypothetical protein